MTNDIITTDVQGLKVQIIPSTILERLAEAVHRGWMAEKRRQGVSQHPDMLPYDQLPESVKDYDRATVRAVLLELSEIDTEFSTETRGES